MELAKYFLNPKDSLKDAIKVIDSGAAQVALIVNSKLKLLGIVTDGDIRRAILADVKLSEPIEKVMTKNPITLTKKTEDHAYGLMQKYAIHHVPVVDKENIIQDLVVLDKLIQKPKFENPVVIMAGGKGERLRPYTENCPKPMLEIKGQPMLEIILRRFIEHGFSNFYFSVNYLKEKIINYFENGERWGVKINYLEEEFPMGTAGSLSLLPKSIDKEILVINGDVLSDIDFSKLLNFHLKKSNSVTLCAKNYEVSIPFAVLNNNDGLLCDIQEKPSFTYLINAGVYVLSPSSLQMIPREFYNLTELISQLLEKSKPVSVFPLHEVWEDLGTIDSLANSNK